MLNFLRQSLSKIFGHQYYLSLCCIVKDENEYLEEWITYHMKVGVQHIFIYDNASKVSVRETLKGLPLYKHVTVIDFPGTAKQLKAYKHCIKRYGYTSYWIGFIDADEFIVPKTSPYDVTDFMKAYEAYAGLGINWLVFGSNRHLKRTNRPLLQSFTCRAKEDFDVNQHIKCIVQPNRVSSVPSPHSFIYKKHGFCVNENFERIKGAFSPVSVQKIRINHYYCRSLEEYQDKVARGYSDQAGSRSLEHFYAHDRQANQVQDTLILDILTQKSGKAFK